MVRLHYTTLHLGTLQKERDSSVRLKEMAMSERKLLRVASSGREWPRAAASKKMLGK